MRSSSNKRFKKQTSTTYYIKIIEVYDLQGLAANAGALAFLALRSVKQKPTSGVQLLRIPRSRRGQRNDVSSLLWTFYCGLFAMVRHR